MRGLEQIPWCYDPCMWLAEVLGLDRWRRWLVGGASGRTLDLGCGTGRNLPLYSSDVQVIGLDPHQEVLCAARKRAPGIPLVAASAESLPFRDGSFHTVVSGLVFCSVSDPRRGLAEVRRVLGPGGQLRMLEHVRSVRPMGARFQDLLQPLWTRISGGCHPNRDTETIVETSGFHIEPETRRAKDNLRRFAARPDA